MKRSHFLKARNNSERFAAAQLVGWMAASDSRADNEALLEQTMTALGQHSCNYRLQTPVDPQGAEKHNEQQSTG